MINAIRSLFLSHTPERSSLRKGIFVASCSDNHAVKILTKLNNEFPSMHWTLLYRYDARNLFRGEEMLLSSTAVSISQKLAFLKGIRSRKDDIVAIAWTNEHSFGQLKLLGMLTGCRSLLVVNENHELIFFSIEDRHRVLHHAYHQLKKSGIGLLYFAKIFSWILLFPIGILYIIGRVVKLAVIRFWVTRVKKSSPLNK